MMKIISLADVMGAIGVLRLHEEGITGEGVTVAVLDTGDIHPFFEYNVVDYFSVMEEEYEPVIGHGSSMAGAVAGNSRKVRYGGEKYDSVGAAPGVDLIIGRCVDNDGKSEPSAVLLAITTAITRGADIISLSVGFPSGPTILSEAVDLFANEGILFSVAAGNGGPHHQTISCPGMALGAITVGSVDSQFRVSEQSSRGPGPKGVVKPDIMSVGGGQGVTSAGHGKSEPRGKEYIIASDTDNEWGIIHGTSIASATIAGVLALLIQAGMPIDREVVEEVLKAGATQIVGDQGVKNSASGWGVVNAYRSYQYLVEEFK